MKEYRLLMVYNKISGGVLVQSGYSSPLNLSFLMCKGPNKKKSVTTCYFCTLKMKLLLVMFYVLLSSYCLRNIPSLLVIR